MLSIGWINSILIIAYFWTVIGVIITVILENRNPFRTSAWVLLVGFIPFLGLIAYIIFGQKQRKLYRINKFYYKRLQRRPKHLSLKQEESPIDLARLPWQKVINLAENNAQAMLLSLDNSTVYTEGKAFYQELLHDIDQASMHIHIQAYIFDDDEIFTQLCQALVKQSRKGVDVRIIYDYVGSYNMPQSKWQHLSQEGIMVYPFLPVRLPLLSSTVNYRNHRKICIIDGHIGYIGGMNFAKRYQEGNQLGMWRDTHFRLEGDAVSALQSGFLMDWYTVSRRVVSVERFYTSPRQEYEEPPTKALSQFIFGGPLEEHQAIEQLLISLIYQAHSSIRIQTPYFLPTEVLHTALITASLAGISVELMIPERGDTALVDMAMASYLSSLMQAGIKIYRYREGFIHSKLVIVDNEVSCLGSANIDFRSLEHNFEVMGIIYDDILATKLCTLFEEDKKKCLLLSIELWEKRSLLRRLSESIMRLFAPLL